ncbi:MAG: TolC family outer membrane protein [Pseudomonadota bacterium]
MKTLPTITAVAAAVIALAPPAQAQSPAPSGPAAAQTSAAPAALPAPLVEAVRAAIVNNPEVQARWHAFTAADAQKDVAAAGWRPSVDLTYGIGREHRVDPPGTPEQRFNRSAASLTLTQTLFDGFFTPSEVQRLSYAKLTRYYELLEAAENIALEAVRAYADVARYSALVQEAKANYVEHKLTAQQIEERVKAGVSRRVDMDQATGRLALAESNLLTEIANLHDVSARYQRILGVKPPATLPPLRDGLRLAGVPGSMADAMRQGLPASPTINAAYENVRALRQEIESRKAAYWPRVDFRIRQTWGRDIDNVNGRTRDLTAEILLNYNLYRGGADQAREKQAVELHKQARDLQEKACRDVRQTLAIAYNDVVRLREQLGYLDQHRLSTEVAREAYRQQFDIGQRTLLDLLDTQNEYFEASRAYINAQYNEFVAQARTLASMGKLTASLGVSRPDQPSATDAGQDRGELPPEELCPFETPALFEIDKAKAVAEAPVRARPAAPPVPAPAAAPAPAVQKVTLQADALFDFDKAVVTAQGKAELDKLVDKIKAANLDVAIAVGHTDSVGSEAYNERLSLRRAEAVKAYLVSKGIPAAKVRTEGRGEREPIADNATAEGRAKNRRVEVTIIEVGRPAGR